MFSSWIRWIPPRQLNKEISSSQNSRDVYLTRSQQWMTMMMAVAAAAAIHCWGRQQLTKSGQCWQQRWQQQQCTMTTMVTAVAGDDCSSSSGGWCPILRRFSTSVLDRFSMPLNFIHVMQSDSEDVKLCLLPPIKIIIIAYDVNKYKHEKNDFGP